MAVAPIENGKPVETTSQTSLKESEKKKSNSTVDKDQIHQQAGGSSVSVLEGTNLFEFDMETNNLLKRML